MNLLIWLCAILPTLDIADAYCWQPGKNPYFTDAPKVEQIDIATVRVSWFGLVKKRECVDQFLVKYWPRSNPSEYQTSDLVMNNVNYLDLKVTPKVPFQFQAVAREDKGPVGGIDWNKSPVTNFKTSIYNNEVDVETPPSSRPSTQDVKKDGETSKEEESFGSATKIAELSVEMIAIIVVCGVVFLLIVIGIIYKLACVKKDLSDSDDEGDEGDDDFDEKYSGAPTSSGKIEVDEAPEKQGLTSQPDHEEV